MKGDSIKFQVKYSSAISKFKLTKLNLPPEKAGLNGWRTFGYRYGDENEINR